MKSYICGENLTWTLDAEGTLTISGTGTYDGSLWNLGESLIRRLFIKDGLTEIGSGAFGDCTDLKMIYYPADSKFEKNLSAHNNTELVPY